MSVILKYASSVVKVHILERIATDIGVKLGFPATYVEINTNRVWWICVER